MKTRILPVAGQRYGRLVLTGEFTGNPARQDETYFECVCDCGTVGSYNWKHLLTGHTASCGCLRREKARENAKLYLPPQRSEHEVLQHMLAYPRKHPLPTKGEMFGRLTFTGTFTVTRRGKQHSLACLCSCSCGSPECLRDWPDLRDGRLKSCGCLPRERQPWEERFWALVNKTETCWLWTGDRDDAGYGVIHIPGRKQGVTLAHRASWELHKGPIPADKRVLHRCDVRNCVRYPEHLFLGTQGDNVVDMWQKRHQEAMSLSPEQRDEIHQRYTASISKVERALAAQYGVSVRCIRDLRSDPAKRWRRKLL